MGNCSLKKLHAKLGQCELPLVDGTTHQSSSYGYKELMLAVHEQY